MNYTLICKGGVNTGLGHLHRAIAFIEGTKGVFSFNVVAIVDRGLESLFRNISNLILIYNDFELEGALDKIQSEHHLCLIDTVELDNDSCKLIRKRYKTIVSLSPVFNNYSIIDVLFTRFNEYNYPDHIKVFSGLQYAVFNTNCRKISNDEYKRNLDESQLTLAVSMGGVDAPNKTLKVIKSLAKLDGDYTIWVLLGEGYSHSYQEIVDVIKQDSNHEIILAKSNKSMWKILSNCSLAIFAGGLTSFEAIYAGLPTINVFEKEIHKSIISKEIEDKQVSINLGLLSDETLSLMNAKLDYFYRNRNELLKMREKCEGLLDNLGPQRTMEIVNNLL